MFQKLIFALAATVLTLAAQSQPITVYPGPANIAIGSSRSLTAYVPLSPNTIIWSINGIPGGDATVGTITPAGVYTAPATPPTPNTITIQATSTAFPTKFGTATLNITYPQPYIWSSNPSTFAAGPVSLTLNGASFRPTTTAKINDLPLTVTYFSPTKIVLTGNVPTSMAGTAQLRVAQPAPGAISSDPLPVTVKLSTVSVSLSPLNPSVQSNATRQFTATVTGNANTAVTWSTTGGSISSTGLFTAPAALGTVIVKATSMADPNVSASTTVTITAPVTTVTVNPTNPTITTGASQQFTATVTNNANIGVTWSTSAGSITATGLYTSPASPGPATVTATSMADPTKSATANLTIAAPVTTITLTPPSTSVPTGSTQQFTATVSNNPNTAVTYSATAGTISAAGLFTAPASVPSPSTVTIKATSVADPTKSATASVTITVALPPVNLSSLRFLDQAAHGPSATDLAAVNQSGPDAWLTQQFNLAETPIAIGPDINTAKAQFFYRIVHAPDQLRQRMINALAKIIVISANKNIYADELVPYWQILSRNAFGNYRQLLGEITMSPQMGKYLDLANSVKPGLAGGSNENYARELMQLFTIGLVQLNLDGTPKLDSSGQTIPTYSQSTVAQTALALTGWTYPTAPGASPRSTNWENFSAPIMETREGNHDTTAKTLANGCISPSGQTVLAETNLVLDCLFNHPNIGPFLATRLIRDFVTSNPTPAYVQRVATVFNNNGFGVRGDLKAVLRAILLDPEARNDTATPTSGRLKDPHYQFAAVIRALNGSVSPNNTFSWSFVAQAAEPLTPPSVFGFYSAGYRIPHNVLNGPEFQIYTPTESMVRGNFLYDILSGQSGAEITINLSSFQAAAATPTTLIDLTNNTLLYGRMPQAMKTSLATAIAAMPDNNGRAITALYLTLLSGFYAVQY